MPRRKDFHLLIYGEAQLPKLIAKQIVNYRSPKNTMLELKKRPLINKLY